MENTNKNNLKVGDVIVIEEAWEDELGQYHDESAEIKGINDNGELTLEWILNNYTKEQQEDIKNFLSNTDGYMANDYKS